MLDGKMHRHSSIFASPKVRKWGCTIFDPDKNCGLWRYFVQQNTLVLLLVCCLKKILRLKHLIYCKIKCTPMEETNINCTTINNASKQKLTYVDKNVYCTNSLQTVIVNYLVHICGVYVTKSLQTVIVNYLVHICGALEFWRYFHSVLFFVQLLYHFCIAHSYIGTKN